MERNWREVNGPTANLITWKSFIFSIVFWEGACGSQSKGEAGHSSDRLPEGWSKCFLISIHTDSAGMDSGALLHLLMGSAWLSWWTQLSWHPKISSFRYLSVESWRQPWSQTCPEALKPGNLLINFCPKFKSINL